jgi:hypothetical protein
MPETVSRSGRHEIFRAPAQAFQPLHAVPHAARTVERNLSSSSDGLADFLDRRDRVLRCCLHPGDLGADLLSRFRGLGRQRFHLRGDNCEVAAGFARPCRLDGGIERQRASLIVSPGDRPQPRKKFHPDAGGTPSARFAWRVRRLPPYGPRTARARLVRRPCLPANRADRRAGPGP